MRPWGGQITYPTGPGGGAAGGRGPLQALLGRGLQGLQLQGNAQLTQIGYLQTRKEKGAASVPSVGARGFWGERSAEWGWEHRGSQLLLLQLQEQPTRPLCPIQPCALPPFDSLVRVGILRPIPSIWELHRGLSAPWGLPIRYFSVFFGKMKSSQSSPCKYMQKRCK